MDDLKIISVSDLFTDTSYVVPIYQRNYAWRENEIEQLIEDIYSSIIHDNQEYFLGNLIVNQTDNNKYEVIDGQQRLTTLFLLINYLNKPIEINALQFEARENSNRTLESVTNDNFNHLREDLSSGEILDGHWIIDRYFKKNKIDIREFEKKLDNVLLVRVQVPQNINLNHYFEIMNTRGEQLELHEIAKAKFLAALESKNDKDTAALIWDKCTDMNSYLQMNYDPAIRSALFTNDWTQLKNEINDFDAVTDKIININYYKDQQSANDASSLFEILENNELMDFHDSNNELENERFESTISFPVFLLQVNAVIRELGEEDSTLDDKHFLNNLSWAWENAEKAKQFLFHMLKCRVLFDKYIIKREYARNYKETGRWSLQRLEKYNDNNSHKPKYVGTFGDDNSVENKQIRNLQACLRITYTSPKTMHWISLILMNLLKDESTDIVKQLERYCQTKVSESDFENASGFGFDRIVFTYLDYLLYRDGYCYKDHEIISQMRDDWQFQFRNSIEHFMPQFLTGKNNWGVDELNSFGNLALLTVSGNSKFSNLPPAGKVISYPSIINQSLKLKIMNELVLMNNHKWDIFKAKEHEKEMFRILKNDISCKSK